MGLTVPFPNLYYGLHFGDYYLKGQLLELTNSHGQKNDMWRLAGY